MKITDKLVQKLMEKWWTKLGLEDWRIQWEWKTQDNIDNDVDNGEESSAYTERFAAERAARIFISSERKWEYPGTPNIDDDIERVVAHELAHIYFTPQDEFVYMAESLTLPFLPKTVCERNKELLKASREGYVRSFVELLLRQDRIVEL